MDWLLALIDPVKAISQAIANAYIAKQNAVTEQAKVEADTLVKTLEARRDVLVAEAHTPWNVLMRAWLALPPSFVVAKILVWDKALGSVTHGHTDPLDPNMWYLVMGIYGFYFLTAKK